MICVKCGNPIDGNFKYKKVCLDCKNKRHKEWYLKNKVRVNKNKKKYPYIKKNKPKKIIDIKEYQRQQYLKRKLSTES